jgi:hypothetical protein
MLARDAGIPLPMRLRRYNRLLGPRLVPRIFRRPKRYCCGVLLLSQVVIAAILKRTTASSDEQK